MSRLKTVLLIIAVVVAFYIIRFGYKAYKIYKGPKKPENIELVQRDLKIFTNSATNYYQKPVFLGGGGGSFDGFGLNRTSLSAVMYSADSMSVINENGVYHLQKGELADTVFVLEAHPRNNFKPEELTFEYEAENPVVIYIGPSGKLEDYR